MIVRTIQLSPQELTCAGTCAVNRSVSSMAQGFKDRHGLKNKTDAEKYWAGFVGACAEMAFARIAGAYWHPHFNHPKHEPDVYPDWQVRWSSYGDGADLIIRNGDYQFKYALMTGTPPVMQFRGWIAWNDETYNKMGRFYEDRGGYGDPCWWIPQSELLTSF
jgi:hypothetical protein